MLPTKIHHQRMITTVSFKNNLLQRLCQILHCPLKLKIFNLQSSNIGCNNLLVPKNIIFSRGPNMAPQRFCIWGDDQPLHQMNFDVSLYFQFSSFNIDFNLLLLYHCKVARPFQSIM
jgi:hypothetical protein